MRNLLARFCHPLIVSAEFAHLDRVVHISADVSTDSMRALIAGVQAPSRVPFALESSLFHDEISRSSLPAGGQLRCP